MPAKLDINWRTDALEQEAVELNLVREIARPRPDLRCPECNAVLYSRRMRQCSVCGDDVPEGFLFSDVEAARIEQLLKAERQRHRDWLNKRSAL